MSHSKLSPSSRHRWSKCPGSVREEAKYPDNSGLAALDGTRSHAVLEHCLLEDVDPLSMVGEGFLCGDDSFTVDAERANRVAVACNYAKGRNYSSEKRVNPSRFVGRDDLTGTCDIVIVDGAELEIVDYKDGFTPVSAVDNAQMEIYALGELAEHEDGRFDTVKMTIIQPKAFPQINSHTITVAELLAKVPDIKAQADATDDPDAPLIPGESQCKWCKAKGNCPALVNHSLELVNVSLLDPAAINDPAVMSDEQLAKVLKAAPLVRTMLASAEEEVLKRLQAGNSVPGFKLVNGRGSRQWALSDDEIAEKLKKMGVPKTAIYKTELVSVAQAEKLAWEKNGEKQSLSARQLATMKQEYIVTKAGKLTVAPESDPRQAVTVDVSSLFQLPKWLTGE
jgi:hypothetical protein